MCVSRRWRSPDMVKTPDELTLMHVSGKMLASVFEMLDEQELAGMSTLQVNDLVDRFITDRTSGVEGKSVSVRVDLGGRSHIKITRTQHDTQHMHSARNLFTVHTTLQLLVHT